MSGTYNYPAEVERDEDGRYVITFPDFGWGATDGATLDEALAEARDLLAGIDCSDDAGGRGTSRAVPCDEPASPRCSACVDRIEGGALRSIP